MAGHLNGLSEPGLSAPKDDIARGLYAALAQDGDTAWDELAAAERESLADYAELALALHVEWLASRGFKIIPPGATPIPKSEAEALAMVQAAKGFFDAHKRKGKLVSTAATPRLIVPGKLN